MSELGLIWPRTMGGSEDAWEDCTLGHLCSLPSLDHLDQIDSEGSGFRDDESGEVNLDVDSSITHHFGFPSTPLLSVNHGVRGYFHGLTQQLVTRT